MILERLKAIIDKQFFFGQEITPETKLVEDLGADSFDIPNLISTLEEEYQIRIEDDEIISIRTIGDIAQVIEAKLT